jgi:molybdenum-dependent DNA-binding transcriptional regulator ModE
VLIQAIRGTAVRRAGANYLSVREVIDTMTRILPEAVRNELGGATQTPDYIWLQGSDLLDFPLVPLL